MKKVQLLAELQRVDSTLDRGRERLATVTALLADRSALAAVEAEHEAVRADLHRKATEQRDLDLEVEDLRGKLQTLERKLYSGTVMNPKELDAMAQDARQYRGLISTREDRLIELFDVVDAATRAEAEAAARLKTAVAEHKDGLKALAAERDELKAAIARDEREREALRAEAEPQALRTYDSLRRTKGGLAVARVEQRTCQGCRVTVPLNEANRARGGDDIVLCQSCGRILYGAPGS